MLPLMCSAVVVLGAAFPLPSLLFFGDPGPPSAFELFQSFDYLLVSPVARLLDELTLLTDRQHLAVVVSLVLCGMGWGVLRVRGDGKRRLARRNVGLVAGSGAGLASAILIYSIGALVPRPMVRLLHSDPSVLFVDFHSHTDHSHDGRWLFDAEANRAWHASAGFHAAYITDHQTMRAWQALADRGALAGEPDKVRVASVLGVLGARRQATLLPGIETVVPGAHLTLLGVRQAHAPLFVHRRDLDTLAFASASQAESRPLAVLTLPFNLERDPARMPTVDAVEISDGSPKGLAFARRYRLRIIALADSLRVPLVASSNNHGWGATAAAWTAMRIPGWQRLTPSELDGEIRATLQVRSAAVGVIERNALTSRESFFGDVATLPGLLIHSWRIAHPLERVAALLWLWSIWLVRLRWRTASMSTLARQGPHTG